MRKFFVICIAIFALCFAFESFGAELVSANYGYKFKEVPKLQDSSTPKPNQVKKDDNETKKTPPVAAKNPTSSPSKNPVNSLSKNPNSSNPTDSEQDNTAGISKTNQNANEKSNEKPEKSDEIKSGGWIDNIWTLLLYVVGGIAGLAVLGGLVWLIYSMISNTFEAEREIRDRGLKSARRDSLELGLQIKELEKTIKLQSGQFTQIQTSMQSLQRQLSELGGQNYQQRAIAAQAAYKPEPKFPVLAEDYINKMGANAQAATADPIGGVLVSNPDKGKEFLIVKDNDLRDGLFYAVPSQSRFSIKSDFFNHYQHYYKCENPSGGTIWIKSPATVRRVNDGWMLVEMGELEIR